MRRTIVMLVAVTMIMGIFAPVLGVGHASAMPEPEVLQGNEHATMIMSQWHQIGHDEYGDPLPGGKSFPWQHEGESLSSYWGREEYGMPNANLALTNAGVARQVRQNNFAATVQPMLWTQVYLTIIADNGQSRPIVDDRGEYKGVGRWYVIMDTTGQVWFDMDGHFHDSRYLASADPFSPYYIQGLCLVNPDSKVDPADANNTQGPYHFSEETAGGEENLFFVNPTYFWVRPNMINKVSSLDTNTTCDAYANHTLTGESRVWQLGILSKPDYLGEGITSPLGNISDGIVRAGEWDIGTSVLPFGSAEMFADAYGYLNSVGPAPGNGTFDVGDPLYRDNDGSNSITAGDVRLDDVTVGVPPGVTTFLAGTTVAVGDRDATTFGGPAPDGWSDDLFSMPPGFIYSSAGAAGGTEFSIRHLGNPATTGQWSVITPAGFSFIAAEDVSEITAGTTVRLGPNAMGQSQICNVTSVWNTAPAVTRSNNYNSWNCGGGYDRAWYYYYMNGFNAGDYVYFGSGGTGEMLRITNLNGSYGYYYSNCSGSSWYRSVMYHRDPVFNHDQYSYYYSWMNAWIAYGYDVMRRVEQGLLLDCVLGFDFAAGDPIVPIGYQPGDFIYFQANPGANSIEEDDIRQTNIDRHRNTTGYIMGQGAWEFDALVMLEVLFADPNDPRYHEAVHNSDWKLNSMDSTEYTLSSEDDEDFNTFDHPYANCMPTYDISVETDFWQGERVWIDDPANPGSMISIWKGVQPSVTTCALRSPNDDVDPAHHRIAKQTVLGPKPDDFFIHTATIHNVTPDYREYLGLELFVDNEYDNNPVPNLPSNAPVAFDLHDNYQRGDVCSAYAGATSRAPDLDLGRNLTRIDNSKDYPKFIDTDNPTALPNDPGLYGCNEPLYFDLDQNGLVSAGDRRGNAIDLRSGTITSGGLMSFEAGSIVQPGDSDVDRVLSRFLDPITLEPVYKWYDIPHEISRLPSGLIEAGEPIYWDHPELPDYPAGDSKTDPGDIRLSDVDVASAHYFCGETMGIGDVFTNEFPLFMISMGKNGDYNYMDFPVLPFPTMDVTVEMDMPLKVEQTSNVKITVEPPPKPGESIFVALRDTRLEARQPVEAIDYYSMQNVEGDWLECSDLSPRTNWHATGTYGAGMYRENVNIGFSFTFFGRTYTRLEIGYNGYVNLGTAGRYYTSLYRYSGYWRYPMYAVVDPLGYTNRPARIHALGAMWRAPADVCYGNAIWPATGETVFVVSWRGQNYYGGGLLEAQIILFQNGEVIIQFQNSACPAYYIHDDMEVGICDGNGTYYEWLEQGPCGFSSEGNVKFTPGTIPARLGRPALDIAEDSRWITEDNPVANFEFTPYRGTCLQDGTRSPVEINLYRDVGGMTDPTVLPRNPPPKTYLTYREPSYNVRDPWNGRVVAVQNTYGYLPGDWVLIGGLRNTERRRITQVHSGTEGAHTEMIETNFNSVSSTRRSHILPVKDIEGFPIGNTIAVGWNTSPTQETHIIEAISRDIAYDDGNNPLFHWTHTTSRAEPGENVSINVNDASGFVIGDFIGYGYYSWWTSTPMCENRIINDVARIIDIQGNTITLNRIHTYWYNSGNRYRVAHIRGIETRDPIKFQHFDECDALDGRAEPVVTARFGFTLHRGLNYNHIFGEPVVGIVYFDTFWVDNKWERFDLDMYPTRQFSSLLSPDIVSPDLSNAYDCFWRGRFDIAPEEIVIEKARDCILVLDERFPNVLLTLIDADNPNDVNDPADIPISCPAGISGVDQTIIANVNVSGCGVDYLITCGTASPNRFIVQVNDDGTYWWWRWYEPLAPTQIFGALDPNDWLYTWLDDSQSPALIPPPTRTPLPVRDNQYDLRLTDNDCSLGGGVCDSCNEGSKLPCFGDVTLADAYGLFMGTVADPFSLYPNPQPLPAPYPSIENFGVPCAIDRWELGSDGGQIMFPVKPLQSGTLDVRVYTYQAVFDYNSSNIHWPGPYFAQDTSMGVDYCGYTTIKVLEPDSDVNFIEFRIADHALQNSQLNYTTGVNPLYPMLPPAPRIQAPYNPIVYNYNTQVRCYPGGQTHTGRLQGSRGHLWNAYPAIWENQFVKMGTEYYPLTDYGMYFILANGEGNHLGYGRSPTQEPDLALRYMTIKGPFMRPLWYDEPSLNCILGGMDSPYYEYNNIIGLPISYDYSGIIDINPSNFGAYCDVIGNDYSRIGEPMSQADSVPYDYNNNWLGKWKDLYYGGFWRSTRTNYNSVADPVTPCYPYVWVIDEIIPTGPGDIEIELELYNDVKKVYQDCCQSDLTGTKDGIPVHGLKIEGAPQFVTVLEDNVFDLTLTEDSGKGMLNNGEWLNIECNNAVLFAWQDRGVVDPDSNYWFGALDGQIIWPPMSSELTNVETAFDPVFDRNNDGYVTFNDWETEIVGRYNMATNTWEGGMIDARTYQRENGKYTIELTEELGCRIDQVGIDIGGRDENGRPLLRNHVDHIIDNTETCPFNITAYKYGDDNQDRGFSPFYDEDWSTGFSHEVYLAGQVSIGVEPRRDLNITYSPEPLTAGVIPEKLGDPLTFHVTDYNGESVDLFTLGISDAHGETDILDRAVWQNLFKDPLPDNDYYYGRGSIMPQYYWLRTDIHNYQDEEGSFNYNPAMYNSAFLPIDFISDDSENGNYSFKGFIANDKGEFEVYIYTPDRRHSGVVTVKVVSPKVSYEIANNDATGDIFDVPSTNDDPDFVMTGGDNRTYLITATCRNAQDALLKGVAKGVSVCSGEGEDIARFTLATTIPHNYWYGDVTLTDNGYTETYYHNFAGIDINGDNVLTQLSMTQSEYAEIRYMKSGSTPVYYNTFNTKYSDGSYETIPWIGWGSWYPDTQGYQFFELRRGISQFMSHARGWGRGCIYNDLYHGTYLFPDYNSDSVLSFRDSFSLDEQGRTTFYLAANDGCILTGLVGYNEYCNVGQFADVAGSPGYYTAMDPNYSRYRFTRNSPDEIFKLDWEAWADTELSISPPDIEIIEPLTGEPWKKDLLNSDNYDLTYAVKNHMLVRVYPADRRDLPIKLDAIIQYASPDKDSNESAPKFETMVVGRLVESEEDPNARETHIYVDPTGTGESTAGLLISEEMTVTYNPMGLPVFSHNMAIVAFDVVKGIHIIPEIAGALKVGVESTLTVKVVVAGGADEPVAGIKVTLDGENGIVEGKSATTNDKGVVEFKVTPTKPGKIIIRAKSEEYGTAVAGVGVEIEVVPPMLIVNSLPSTTKDSTIKVAGKTTIGALIKIGADKVKVKADGSFEHEVSLVDGYNSIEVTASNTAGMSTSLTVSITRDSIAPEIILDQDDPNVTVFGPNVVLTGKVEPYSTVTVNGQPADVVYDTWRIELNNVATGKLEVTIEAVDPAGNENSKDFEVTVVGRTVMVLQVGSLNVTINDSKVTPLNRAPKVVSGVFYAPISALTQFFGDTGASDISGKIDVTINGKAFVMTAGTNAFTLDGEDMSMPNPPIDDMGIKFVDVQFFAQILEIDTDWDKASNKMVLTKVE